MNKEYKSTLMWSHSVKPTITVDDVMARLEEVLSDKTEQYKWEGDTLVSVNDSKEK